MQYEHVCVCLQNKNVGIINRRWNYNKISLIRLQCSHYWAISLKQQGTRIAGYNNLDILKRIDMILCKQILYFKYSAPNVMMYDKLGRCPISVIICFTRFCSFSFVYGLYVVPTVARSSVLSALEFPFRYSLTFLVLRINGYICTFSL